MTLLRRISHRLAYWNEAWGREVKMKQPFPIQAAGLLQIAFLVRETHRREDTDCFGMLDRAFVGLSGTVHARFKKAEKQPCVLQYLVP